MSNTDAKTALITGREVIYDGSIYKCVSAIIYRKGKEKICVSLELQDKNGNSSVIVRQDEVVLAQPQSE